MQSFRIHDTILLNCKNIALHSAKHNLPTGYMLNVRTIVKWSVIDFICYKKLVVVPGIPFVLGCFHLIFI